MNKSRYKLDEMQEQKLLKIERNACWLAFWGLAAVLVVQVITIGDNLWNSIAGEWILFMAILEDKLRNKSHLSKKIIRVIIIASSSSIQ